ncbi:MAG: peptide deformylase [bacterium]|nr:peptide deformylase [bacterium]
MVPEIVQNGAPVLRAKATEVPLSDIGSAKIQKILKDMAAALNTQDDGVAIAAPQIGVSLRIFLVAKATLTMPENAEERKKVANRKELKLEAGCLTFINPTITKLSRDKATLDEGCLSVRPLYGKIKRSKKATVTAYDENGVKFTRGASGLLAQIFQHETDHLEGILFIDKATNLREMPTGDELGSKN